MRLLSVAIFGNGTTVYLVLALEKNLVRKSAIFFLKKPYIIITRLTVPSARPGSDFGGEVLNKLPKNGQNRSFT